jgi:hypothetical protein
MTSGKSLAHRISKMTVSQKAGLFGQMKCSERQVVEFTDDQLVKLIGVSKTNGRKAAKASADERKSLVRGKLTMSDLNGAAVQVDLLGLLQPTAEELLEREQQQLSDKADVPAQRMTIAEILATLTVSDFLAAYQRMTPAERVAIGRGIGIDRVWQPSSRTASNSK